MTQPDDPNRIHWRDFIQTRAYAYTQFVLKLFKYELVILFDDQDHAFAFDVYVRKYAG